jgi:hypothetical protein
VGEAANMLWVSITEEIVKANDERDTMHDTSTYYV